MWCANCASDRPTDRDEISGSICCTGCGRVLDNEVFSSEATFLKTSGGQSRLAGSIVRSARDSDVSESHERTLARGRNEIEDLVIGLSMAGGDDLINQAHRLYTIAVERNFTRGRRTKHVAAACLYIICRLVNKPYLLIDFSDFLQINVYVLGAVFLQLCELLRLEENPIIQKPVDPSLFIHRFTFRLLGTKEPRINEILMTANRIIKSMKRDWMQTGRKPNGLCGAALYIAALSFGLKYSKAEVVNVVHICEATLTKRLIEFENTESGGLTIEEFNAKAKEFEADAARHIENAGSQTNPSSEILCEHKNSGAKNFAHGLCRTCYDDFLELSGGIIGGSDPPAFQKSERQRMALKSNENAKEFEIHEVDCESDSLSNQNVQTVKAHEKIGSVFQANENVGHKISGNTNDSQNTEGLEGEAPQKSMGHSHSSEMGDESNGASFSHQTDDKELPIGEEPSADFLKDQDIRNSGDDASETLSDIDDNEVDGYLHDEEEIRLKTIIWTEMNKEYLEEQAAKETAAAAARAAFETNRANWTDEMSEEYEPAAKALAAVMKLRKERQQKRAEEARSAGPADTAAEATRRMLIKKRFSSKINYDKLEKLFDDPGKKAEQANNDRDEGTETEHTKKQRTESEIIDNVSREALQSDAHADVGEEYGEGLEDGEDDTYRYYENPDDGYGYEDDGLYDDGYYND